MHQFSDNPRGGQAAIFLVSFGVTRRAHAELLHCSWQSPSPSIKAIAKRIATPPSPAPTSASTYQRQQQSQLSPYAAASANVPPRFTSPSGGAAGGHRLERKLVEDTLGGLLAETRKEIQRDVQNLHLDMLRQFEDQQAAMATGGRRMSPTTGASSPPRPKTKGSPPLRRKTRLCWRDSSIKRCEISRCFGEGLPPRLPAYSTVASARAQRKRD